MQIEYVPLSSVTEVSEVPEGADVLINDAGTIKKVDASKIGGGGDSYDLVFTFDVDEPSLATTATRISGSYVNIRLKLANHLPVKVFAYFDSVVGDYGQDRQQYSIQCVYLIEDAPEADRCIGIIVSPFDSDYRGNFLLLPDNTMIANN